MACGGKIWGLNMPPKVTLFLWRLVHGILPVRVVLARRGMVDDNTCQVCGVASESVEHMIFECEAARRMWRASRLGFDFSVGVPMAVGDWLVRWWKKALDKYILVESFAIMWVIWCRRNDFVFRHV